MTADGVIWWATIAVVVAAAPLVGWRIASRVHAAEEARRLAFSRSAALMPQSQRDRIARIKEAASRISNGLFWKGAVYAGNLDPWVSVLDAEVGALMEHAQAMAAVHAYLRHALAVCRERGALMLDQSSREASERTEADLLLALNDTCNDLLIRYPARCSCGRGR